MRLLLIILDLLVVGLLKEFCDGLQRFLFLAAVGVIHDSGEMSLVLVFGCQRRSKLNDCSSTPPFTDPIFSQIMLVLST